MRVLPDVAGLDKTFDYLVPDELGDQVRVGTIVRIGLHGRRVRGWVVADGVEPPPGITLRPLAKVTGWGPPPEVVELATWAAWRWAGRRRALLVSASPDRAVPGLPEASTVARPGPPTATPADPETAALVRAAFDGPRAVLRLPPGADRFPVAVEAVRRGRALLLVPNHREAAALAQRLRRSGEQIALLPGDWPLARAGASTVGTRAGAMAPLARPDVVVVFDEHDEAYQEERAPTWHARDVAVERADRLGVPCVLVSPVPSLEAQAWSPVLSPSRTAERAGWPVVDVADRRTEDPVRSGLFSPVLVDRLRSDRRVVCVLNRVGRSRLLACGSCGAVAVCERCGSAVGQDADGVLACRQCGTRRPQVCQACGGSAMRNLRSGVSRVREELEAIVREPVVEVSAGTAPTPDGPGPDDVRVVVGTEAVLHQVRRADVVAFLDFDQELLAPRYRAGEEALGLLARAGRLVGGRSGGGRVLIQTRHPDHPVVEAALHADPERWSSSEQERRAMLRFPPYAALAEVSGPAGDAFLEALGRPLGVEVAPLGEGHVLLRATDHQLLCDALGATQRPGGRLRVAVDPLRI